MLSKSLPKIYSISNFDLETDETNETKEIAHIGIGNFHRAHQQSYLNDLMKVKDDRNERWKYTGIGMLSHDKEIQMQLKKNNFVYNIVTIDNDGSKKIEEIHTLKDYLIAYEDIFSCVLKLAEPNVLIVSLTITEHGYAVPLSENDKTAINACLKNKPCTLKNLSKLSTFGLIMSALALRYMNNVSPFTVMSCDNICENGKICQEKCKTEHPDFQEWIDSNCKFPSTMVDRITPSITRDEIIQLEQENLLIDMRPVTCEPYKSWIIEDNFVNGIRPDWESVGVIMTDDVKSYELIKLSILNVTHSYIGHIGTKCKYIHEALEDFNIFYSIHSFLHEEIIPILDEIISIDFDLRDYADKVLHRFENKYIKDTIQRINQDKEEKMRKQAIPIFNTGMSLGKNLPLFKKWLEETNMLY